MDSRACANAPWLTCSKTIVVHRALALGDTPPWANVAMEFSITMAVMLKGRNRLSLLSALELRLVHGGSVDSENVVD